MANNTIQVGKSYCLPSNYDFNELGSPPLTVQLSDPPTLLLVAMTTILTSLAILKTVKLKPLFLLSSLLYSIESYLLSVEYFVVT